MSRENLLCILYMYNIILQNNKLNPQYKQKLNKHSNILLQILESTSYMLHHATTGERIYHIKCGLYEYPKCKWCQKSLVNTFIRSGYRDTCCFTCEQSLGAHNMKTTLKNNPQIVKNRINIFKNTVTTTYKDGIILSSYIAYKSANTKLNTIIDGKTQIQIQTEKAKNTKIKNGNAIPDDQLTAFEIYAKKVWYFTRKQNIKILDNYELRGHYKNNGFHLDHKYSIYQGFLDGINPEVIGNIHNLEFIHCITNYSKGIKCSISLDELYTKFQSNE